MSFADCDILSSLDDVISGLMLLAYWTVKLFIDQSEYVHSTVASELVFLIDTAPVMIGTSLQRSREHP